MSDDGLFRKIEYLANTLERMRLDEYLDFVSNRRRMALTAFLGGVMRGRGDDSALGGAGQHSGHRKLSCGGSQ